MKTLWIIGLALGYLLLRAGQISATEYEVVRIGTLGGTGGVALDINTSGQVVGHARNAHGDVLPFLWTVDNGISELLLPPGAIGGRASAINDNGWIVGETWAPFNSSQTTIWRPGHSPLVLDGLLGLSISHATGVNNSGQVVGFAYSTVEERHAFLWSENDGAIDLGTLGGTDSLADDINDSGVIVGNSELDDNKTVHAFVWIAGDGISDLYPDWPLRDYVGIGINSAGDIVGQGEQVGDRKTPVFWPSNGGVPVYANGEWGWAGDINNRGMIVGRYREVSYLDPDHAFVWDGGDSLVTLPMLEPDGRYVAEAINDTGWIVGWGTDNGQEVPLLWTPEPTTLAMLSLGGVAMLRRQKHGGHK